MPTYTIRATFTASAEVEIDIEVPDGATEDEIHDIGNRAVDDYDIDFNPSDIDCDDWAFVRGEPTPAPEVPVPVPAARTTLDGVEWATDGHALVRADLYDLMTEKRLAARAVTPEELSRFLDTLADHATPHAGIFNVKFAPILALGVARGSGTRNGPASIWRDDQIVGAVMPMHPDVVPADYDIIRADGTLHLAARVR